MLHFINYLLYNSSFGWTSIFEFNSSTSAVSIFAALVKTHFHLINLIRLQRDPPVCGCNLPHLTQRGAFRSPTNFFKNGKNRDAKITTSPPLVPWVTH